MENRDKNHAGACRWTLFLFIAIFVASTGCGGGGLGLTGGSIPIGVASIQGSAVRADDITKPVSDAVVVLSVGSASGQARTDSTGRFAFQNIAGGKYICTIAPPGVTALRAWDDYFQFADGARVQLNAALLPATFNSSNIDHVSLIPNGANIHVGDKVRFIPHSIDANGLDLHMNGSLLLVGDVGDLDMDGTLHATKAGVASFVAWAGDSLTTATVTVSP